MKPVKRETLNLRIKPRVRELIDRAAELAGKNRTDFVLDAARRTAEDALLERAVFTVSPKSIPSIPGAPGCSAEAE